MMKTVETHDKGQFRVGAWTVEPGRNLIRSGTCETSLQPKIMDLLVYLATRQGDVVSADELNEKLWKGMVVGTGSVYRSIADLRHALGDNKRKPLYIETIPKRGYRLIGEVEFSPDKAAGGGTQSDPVAPLADKRLFSIGLTGRQAKYILYSSLLLGFAVVMFSYLRLAPTAQKDGHLPPNTIAVLPFSDISIANDQQHLAHGIAEDILNALTKVKGLQVTAKSSSFPMADNASSFHEIRTALHVATILQGSVNRQGDNIQLTVTLVDTASGVQLWTKNYDQNLENIFAMQDEVSESVVQVLQDNLEHTLVSGSGSRRMTNISAYEYYLLGRHYMGLRTRESLEQALVFFQLAIRDDPNYALAYSGLADIYLLQALPIFGQVESVDSALAKAEHAVDKALSINDELAEAYVSKGFIRFTQENSNAAIANHQKAIALNPNLARAHHWLGACLMLQNRLRQSVAARTRAVRLDPRGVSPNASLGLGLSRMGLVEAATEQFGEMLSFSAEHPMTLHAIAKMNWENGELVAGISYGQKAVSHKSANPNASMIVGLMMLDLGQPEAAAPWLTAHQERVFLARGDYQRAAYTALEKSAESSDWRQQAMLAEVLLFAGRYQEALSVLKSISLPPLARDDRLFRVDEFWMLMPAVNLLYLHDKSGNAEAAKSLLTETRHALSQAQIAGYEYALLDYNLARLHAFEGDTTAALAALTGAVDKGWRRWFTAIDPLLNSLHQEPEFQKLLSRIRDEIERQQFDSKDYAKPGDYSFRDI